MTLNDGDAGMAKAMEIAGCVANYRILLLVMNTVRCGTQVVRQTLIHVDNGD